MQAPFAALQQSAAVGLCCRMRPPAVRGPPWHTCLSSQPLRRSLTFVSLVCTAQDICKINFFIDDLYAGKLKTNWPFSSIKQSKLVLVSDCLLKTSEIALCYAWMWLCTCPLTEVLGGKVARGFCKTLGHLADGTAGKNHQLFFWKNNVT